MNRKFFTEYVARGGEDGQAIKSLRFENSRKAIILDKYIFTLKIWL